jgi:hypothetical protein
VSTSSSGDTSGYDFEAMHCHSCRRLLLKIEYRALRPGLRLEIRCRCKATNYLIGALTT